MATKAAAKTISGVKVAVVTGSNKGIGKALVRLLCKQYDGHVYLTARDVKNGQQAVEDLQKDGLSPFFHQLDINDPKSIDRLRLHLEQNYGGLDVLVNNAGLAFPPASKAPLIQQAEVTNKTNFWGVLGVCDKLFPLLKDHARVVHVSSTAGAFVLAKCSKEAKDHIKQIKTIPEVEKLIKDYIEDVRNDSVEKSGIYDYAYGVSKMAVNLITSIQQKSLDNDKTRKDILVNALCPGFTATDLNDHTGGKTTEEGADTPLYLALLPPDNAANPRGKFVSERKVRDLECSDEEVKEVETILGQIVAETKGVDRSVK